MNIGPKLRPRVSFMPVIINALRNQGDDPTARAFATKLGGTAKELTDCWDRMSPSERGRFFHLSRNWQPPEGNLAAQLVTLARSWNEGMGQIVSERKRVIRADHARRLQLGAAYQPAPELIRNKSLLYESLKRWNAKTNACCDFSGNSQAVPEEPPRTFGVKTSKLKCHDQREVGHDEIYLVTTAVDGNGQLIARTSPRLRIDDDGDDVLHPNFWIYPMQDPNGFLDIAVSMREDDGGYEEVGAHVAALGSAIATIPNPYALGAGVALAVIGEALILFSLFDADDDYGQAGKTWGNLATLEAGVGSTEMSFYESDDGMFDDGHNLDLTLKMLTA